MRKALRNTNKNKIDVSQVNVERMLEQQSSFLNALTNHMIMHTKDDFGTGDLKPLDGSARVRMSQEGVSTCGDDKQLFSVTR